MIKNTTQIIKKVMVVVMSISLWNGINKADTICINAVIIYPPRIPAEILANCCQGFLVKYLGFAGIYLAMNSIIKSTMKNIERCL